MSDAYHISSLVVRTRPEMLAAIAEEISGMEGAEVFQADALGRMVVILDTKSHAEIAQTLRSIETLPGVLNASLIYHHAEEDTAQTAQEAL